MATEYATEQRIHLEKRAAVLAYAKACEEYRQLKYTKTKHLADAYSCGEAMCRALKYAQEQVMLDQLEPMLIILSAAKSAYTLRHGNLYLAQVNAETALRKLFPDADSLSEIISDAEDGEDVELAKAATEIQCAWESDEALIRSGHYE